MPFDHALRLTSLLLAAASFIGLTLGASLPEWLALATGLTLIGMLLRNIRVTSLTRSSSYSAVSNTTWNILVIIGFVGFWLDIFWISGELLQAGIHFLMVLMVIKLCTLRVRRDYLHLYAISLVAIVASGSLTTDLWYMPVFLIYLMAGVWTLLLFQLTKHSEAVEPSTKPALEWREPSGVPNQVTTPLFWLANGLVLATFGLTILIFFTIPRVSAGIYQKGIGENIRTSGFSDTVNLGSIGPIKRDPSIVMRVELPDRTQREAGHFYVRGVAFDRYDGKSWTNRLSYRRTVNEDATGTFVLYGDTRSRRLGPGDTIRQKILLEPLDTPVLFAAPFVESVTGKFLTIQSDLTGSAYLPYPSSSRIEYTVTSRSAPILPADFQSEPITYSESFLKHFLQVPLHTERIAALAQEIAQAHGSSYEKAAAIQMYLMRNYRYSLDAPLAELDQPLEEFLFARKTGYCEHYATAMAVMLRTIGIPTRLVTGFLTTEWNEYGNYYLVRQQDAHAWVEVYLAHSGWVTLDPTPATGENPSGETSSWYSLARMVDSLRLHWNRFFVQYSAADQLTMIRDVKSGSSSIRTMAIDSFAAIMGPLSAVVGGVTEYLNQVGQWSLAGLVAAVVMGVAILLWLVMRQPWAKKYFSVTLTNHDEAIVHLYRRMVRHLAQHGVAPQVSLPPLELTRLTQRIWSEAGTAVGLITEYYCRARFGRHPLTKDDLRTAEESLEYLMKLKPLENRSTA